jgi:diguanylate cyclase (GGDEF)-like protein
MESNQEMEGPNTAANDSTLPIQQVRDTERLVYLVIADPDYGKSMAQQISHFGYRTQIVQDLMKLDNVAAEHKAVAILVDLPSLEIESSESDIFEQIKEWQQTSIPFIFLSDREDQAVRLNTIRAGGVAFLQKPVNLVSLVDKLDVLNTQYETDPYRVLIVEDQQTVASYYQMVLKIAGMETEIVTEPSKVLRYMQEFHPDLILMDLYMPGIDGIELAKLIRQIDEYVSTPIVFLSSEEDFSKQIEALNLGGDDFLTKPIKASHLVALVKSRLERLRILRSYMMRDSLTGLLNHTSFRGQLMQEINRSKRHKIRLAFSMLDIDNFKQVNDTFGHPVGDTVLKSLSRLLRQRLRRSDIIGRYGGEEFVALLLEVDASNTFQIMDEIRAHFSEIRHFSPTKGVFTTTFSAGIATFPEFENANSLIDAADQALYAAKAAGRNKVMLAERVV